MASDSKYLPLLQIDDDDPPLRNEIREIDNDDDEEKLDKLICVELFSRPVQEALNILGMSMNEIRVVLKNKIKESGKGFQTTDELLDAVWELQESNDINDNFNHDNSQTNNKFNDLISFEDIDDVAPSKNNNKNYNNSEIFSKNCIEEQLQTESSKMAIRMGFPINKIKKVIRNKLKETNQPFASSDDLIEAILNCESDHDDDDDDHPNDFNQISPSSSSNLNRSRINNNISQCDSGDDNNDDDLDDRIDVATNSNYLDQQLTKEPALVAIDLGFSIKSVREAIEWRYISGKGYFSTSDELIETLLFLKNEIKEYEDDSYDLEEEMWKVSSQVAIRIGFSCDRVRAAIKEKLEKTRIGFSSSDDLIEGILMMENDDIHEAVLSNEEAELRHQKNLLLEENKQLKQKRMCKICLKEEIGMAFLPCRHLATCVACAEKFKNCPMCKKKIERIVRAYL